MMNGKTYQTSEKNTIEDDRLLIEKGVLFQTSDSHLNSLLGDACREFYDIDYKVRKGALDKLWDVFECLKTIEYPADKKKAVSILIGKAVKEQEFKNCLDKEMVELTYMGNNFHIRHHEKNKTPIESSLQVDYLYYRMLALIMFLEKGRYHSLSEHLASIMKDKDWCKGFSQFTDIRGSFNSYPNKEHGGNTPRYSINSVNNQNLIKQCHDKFSIGRTGFRPGPKKPDGSMHKRSFYWEVDDKDGLNLLMEFFEQYPPQSTKKQKEYAIWKKMIDDFLVNGYKSPNLPELVQELREARRQSQ
jgi:hypothetical protein